MTVEQLAQAMCLARQAAKVSGALVFLEDMERDLGKDPETRHATTHEVVQRAITLLRDAEEALRHEANVLGGW
jgi:hypothetical protein